MKILYKTILDLQLWHDYYLRPTRLDQPAPFQMLPTDYNVLDSLELIPTRDCRKTLENLGWIFRSNPKGCSLVASVDKVSPNDLNNDFQTTVSVDRPYRLTFWLTLRNSNFSNFTNLSLETDRNHILYFSNLSQNNQEYVLREDNGDIVTDDQGAEQRRLFLFLTQVLPFYTGNTQYRFGQLAMDENNETWEAIAYQDSSTSTIQDTDWKKLGFSQYVTDLDFHPLGDLFQTQLLPNINPGDILQFTLSDVNNLITFNSEITVPDTHPPGNMCVNGVNFAGQAPGYYTYQYRRNDNQEQQKEFVLVDPIEARNAFGLVEIALNSNQVISDFSILEQRAGITLINPKTYIIRFKNRSTYWHYRYEQPHQFTAESLLAFDLIDEFSYITKRPQDLRLRPESLLKDGNEHFLPVPSVTQIKPEISDAQQVTRILSNIYL